MWMEQKILQDDSPDPAPSESASVTILRVDCSYVFSFFSCFTISTPRRLPSLCMTPEDDM